MLLASRVAIPENQGCLLFHGTGDGRYIALHDEIPTNLASYHGSSFNYYIDIQAETGVRVFRKGTLIGTQNLLSASSASFAHYWCGFIDGEITVGHGTEPGKNVIAKIMDPNPLPAQYFSLSSNIAPVYRKISTQSWQGLAETVKAAGEYSWNTSEHLSTHGRGAFQFSIRNTGSGSAVQLSSPLAMEPILRQHLCMKSTGELNTTNLVKSLKAGKMFETSENLAQTEHHLAQLMKMMHGTSFWVTFDNGSIAYMVKATLLEAMLLTHG